jgi:hypothetical protein
MLCTVGDMPTNKKVKCIKLKKVLKISSGCLPPFVGGIEHFQGNSFQCEKNNCGYAQKQIF